MPNKLTSLLWVFLISGCITPVTDNAPVSGPSAADENTELQQTQASAPQNLPYPERPPEPPRPTLLAAAEITTAARSDPAATIENDTDKEVGKIVAKTIIGESENGVKALFGAPHDVVPKFPGHIWKYATDVCDMDIFFYLDIASDTYRVLTLDITPETETENCYGSLANAKG